jgi:hypothetical protein
MPVTAENPGPYAPATAVLDILTRYRSRGLTTPITTEVLERAGISPSLSPRTLYALQVLDLIENDGTPTQTLEGLRLAPESEYQQRLADWLRATYAEVFQFVDPAHDDETRIRDAFRNYRPHGQQNRMVTLFTGLCSAAGLMPEKPQAAARSSTPRPRPQARRPATTRASVKPSASSPAGAPGRLPPALAGLLATLPPDGKWTKDRRDKFVETFKIVLDYDIAVVKEESGGS